MLDVVLNSLLVVIALALTVVSVTTLWWMLHAWSTPAAHREVGFSLTRRRHNVGGFPERPTDEPQLSFSLIVPCREESELVMAATVERLLAQRHPDLEVIISVGDDDVSTVETAQRIAGRDRRVKVSVNRDQVKNKPRQLNTALLDCTKDIVGVIDAESLTQPGLLRQVDATFRRRDADVVQGAVHLINYRATWFSLRNCMEYRTWFRSRLPGHAQNGFIPLGGNTVFLKRLMLLEVGGWDGNCLAEDCEIGVRLSAKGKKIVVAYDADLVTMEEAPVTVRALIKQRTRWALGFMQVLAIGEWRRLPTRQARRKAWWLLGQQHATAFAGLSVPVALAASLLLDVPLGVTLVTFLPLAPTLATIMFEVVILREFGQDMGWRLRVRDYLKLVVTTPLYQLLLAVACLRAVGKYFRGDFAWELTEHAGTHLQAIDLPDHCDPEPRPAPAIVPAPARSVA